ncbi:hypothetical protein DMENIID0001_122360 [Sergentomyia squamirostris]
MTSVQERLQLKRIPLDKWSIREQLFLAAAVACSGENWMSVSRSLKMYCGSNRPSDWFSQKSCAAQYGKLLENVEMPKRKKRTASERDTPTSVDTPGEVIYRKLTQERVLELKKQIQEEQKEFAKLKEDILYLHSGATDEGKIREMWSQIEQEKKQKEREQLQHQQWLKEREERKLEMEKAWRPGQTHLYASSSPSSSPSRGSPLQTMMPLTNLKIKQEEMEIDDLASKQGTSPLLTSLLKSPSPAPNPATPNLSAVITSSPTSSRVAPTITNLLTGHQIHANIQGSSLPTPEITPTIQFLPGILDQQLTSQATPSQAAPTLSMLLDSKNNVKTESFSNCPRPQPQIQTIIIEPKPEPLDIPQQSQQIPEALPENVQDIVKDEDQQLMDDFNGLIPDNIDELADILTDNNAIILSPELLEEESILENVDSLIGVTEVKSKVKEEVPEAAENHAEPDVIIISEEIPKVPTERDQEVQEVLSVHQEELPEEKPVETENSSSSESKNTEKGAQDPPPGEPEPIEIKSEPESSSDCEIRSDENSRPPQEGDSVRLMSTPDDSKSADDKSVQEERSEDPKKDSDSSNSGGTDVQTNKGAEEPIKIEISTDDDDSNMKLSELCEKEINQKEMVTIDLEEVKEEEKVDTDNVAMDLEENSADAPPKDVQEVPTEKESEDAGTSEEARKPSIEEDVFEDAKDTMENEDEDPQQDLVQGQSAGVDTDDDYPIEVIKEDKVGRTKRDYSRKKPETLSVDSKKSEDSNEDTKSNISLRMRLKDRERSESPLVTDDDGSEIIPRTRRRYSSTHATDSIPNSPASSEDREYKAWKKAIMPAYNRLSTHKYASIFLRPVAEDQMTRYRSVVLR